MRHAAKTKMMVRAVRSALLIPLVGGLGMVTSMGVVAQEAKPLAKQPGAIEEVIVTAQRREQALQDVPIAISAFTEDTLQHLGADGFAGYSNLVPGLSFQDRGPGQNRFALRGISAPVSTSAATVGIYIDDLPVSSLLSTPDLSLFDVHSVEVLRGPQGTLYGEGSLGGTIKVMTNRPDLTKFDAAGQAGFGKISSGGNVSDASGMVNLPISSGVAAVRIVAYSRQNDGWIDNVNPAAAKKNANSTKTDGSRLALRLQPTNELDVQLTGTFQKQRLGGFNTENVLLPAGQQNHIAGEGRTDNSNIGSLAVNYKFSGSTLTYIGSTLDRSVDELRDIGGGLSQVTNQKFKTSTNELRLASNGSGKWNWVAGFFSKDSKNKENVVTAALGGLSPWVTDISIKQTAVFGDVSYQITPTLEASVGTRWNKETQSLVNTNQGVVALGFPSLAGANTSDKGSAPRVNLAWRPDDDHMHYASVAKGFRSGGVNRYAGLPTLLNALFGLPPGTFPAGLPTFSPDTVVNYEVGTKNAFSGGRLVVNLAAFYVDWKKIQSVTTFVPAGFGIFNGGKAHTKGVEAEVTWKPTDRLTLGATGSLQQAQFDDPILGTTIQKNDRLFNTPRETLNLSADYEFPVAGLKKAFVRGDVNYMGDIVEIDKSRFLPAYSVGNLRAGARWDKWELAAYINNVANKRAELGYSALTNDVFTNQPRTIGISLRGSM